jgi:aminoglycoside phosphotransferase family enzyme/predicted kinase
MAEAAMIDDDQREVIAFLGHAAAYGDDVGAVEMVATHASLVFLAGDRAYKLKRAVRYPYLDYSTRELRRRSCEAELVLNRRTAPSLYLKIAPVTRMAGGGLALDGDGEAIDWVVVMRRFAENSLFDRLAEAKRLTPALALALVRHIVAFHAAAERRCDRGGTRPFAALIAGNDTNLRAAEAPFDAAKTRQLLDGATAALGALGDLLERRRDAGYVRRCHGDLHLRNICLVEEQPVLFDCIEFSDEIACIDVLYDLAFLLMDLEHRGLRALANLVFNRYLDLAGGEDGVGAMPLFLSTRAAIRAHVTAAAARLEPDPAAQTAGAAAARLYLDRALHYLAKTPPRLIAIGGLSGSGKSTLAAALAPELGTSPGARVLRSDVIRKRLLGVEPETRLPPSAYSAAVTERVYGTMRSAAESALRAGSGVVIDAVSARPDERRQIEEVATRAGVPFSGFWLEGPQGVLESRLAARRGDASDATPAVLREQLRYELGPIGWRRVDASRGSEDVLASARLVLAA